VLITPNIIKGDSTGFIPSQVKIKKTITRGQNIMFSRRYLLLFCKIFDFITRGNIIRIDIISAITPPSLLGIDRKIA
jgi:hypothetical protein